MTWITTGLVVTRLISKRLLWSIPSLAIVSALTFVLAWLIPSSGSS